MAPSPRVTRMAGHLQSEKVTLAGEAGEKAKPFHQDIWLSHSPEKTIIFFYTYLHIFNHKVLSYPKDRLLLPNSTFFSTENFSEKLISPRSPFKSLGGFFLQELPTI